MPHIFVEEAGRFEQVHAQKLPQRPARNVGRRQRNGEYVKHLLRIERQAASNKLEVKDEQLAVTRRNIREALTEAGEDGHLESILQDYHAAVGGVSSAPSRRLATRSGDLGVSVSSPSPCSPVSPTKFSRTGGLLTSTPTPTRASAQYCSPGLASPSGLSGQHVFESSPLRSVAHASYTSPQKPSERRTSFESTPLRSPADARYYSPPRAFQEPSIFENSPARTCASAHYGSSLLEQGDQVFQSTPERSSTDARYDSPLSEQFDHVMARMRRRSAP